MRKEIRTVDEKNGIVQCTTLDERWYLRDVIDQKTGLPKYEFVPSVTWICNSYPKGTQFYKWLASKGWDEAEAIKTAAGDKGSKVHLAVKDLIEGKSVNINDKYTNHSTGEKEELTLEEYECIMSFVDWVKEAKPVFIQWEFVVWGDNYAGTVDLECDLDNKRYLIDFKTSQNIWTPYELQISAYKHAMIGGQNEHQGRNLAILQLGYKLNKKKWKFTEIEDQYDLFLAAKAIWSKENKDIEPWQKDYPLTLRLKGENHETTKKR